MLPQSADGAKLDTIGQGQAIQRQALTGVLGKILSRKDAVAMRYTATYCPAFVFVHTPVQQPNVR